MYRLDEQCNFKDGEVVEFSAFGTIMNGTNGYGGTSEGYLMTINDTVYFAYLDPSDGYRSYGTFERYYGTETPSYKFPPQKVRFNAIEKETYPTKGNEKEIIRFTDITTDKVVLEIGTDYVDEFYPVGFCHYTPENFAINMQPVFDGAVFGTQYRLTNGLVLKYMQGIPYNGSTIHVLVLPNSPTTMMFYDERGNLLDDKSSDKYPYQIAEKVEDTVQDPTDEELHSLAVQYRAYKEKDPTYYQKSVNENIERAFMDGYIVRHKTKK